MQYDEFMKQVRLRGGLHDNEEAKKAIHAVFETLKRRIVHDTGDNIIAQLPHDIQPLWESGFVDHITSKAGGRERLDLSAFISRVADRMETTDFAHVEFITRAVITTLRQAITPGAQESIERELPADLREFWLSCKPPEMPQEAQAAKQHVETTPQANEETITGVETMRSEAEIGGQPLETEQFYPRETTAMGEEPRPMESVVGEETEFEKIYHAEQGVFEMEAPVPTEGEQMAAQHKTYEPKEEMEGKVHPPAEERLEVVPPPGVHKAEEGPGSATHYRLDPQLEQEIKDMLDRSEELHAEKIDVFVQAGNVTLRGKVHNEEQRMEAGRIAAKALGVGDILNELSIEEKR